MKEEIKNRIPEVSDTEMAFGGGDTIPELLKEAKEKGFYNGNTPANKFFSKWFYSGLKEGELNFKEELDKKFKLNASRYLKSFMGSFAPKHEEKEAICSMLINELFILKENNPHA